MNNINQNKKKKRIIVVWTCIIIFVLMITSISIAATKRSCNSAMQESVKEEQTESPTLNFTPMEKKNSNKAITIPTVTGIDMVAYQTQQRVLFENPKSNNCLFRIRLYLSDETLIWKSDYIEPNNKIVEEELFTTLERGVYKNCKIYYDCYTLDKLHQLNGAMFEIEINVQ